MSGAQDYREDVDSEATVFSNTCRLLSYALHNSTGSAIVVTLKTAETTPVTVMEIAIPANSSKEFRFGDTKDKDQLPYFAEGLRRLDGATGVNGFIRVVLVRD